MAVSANRLELLQIADAVAREKSIDKGIVIASMEDALQKAARLRYGQETEVRAEINQKTGEVRFSRVLNVVELVDNDATQISLVDARKRNPAAEVGDWIAETLPPIGVIRGAVAEDLRAHQARGGGEGAGELARTPVVGAAVRAQGAAVAADPGVGVAGLLEDLQQRVAVMAAVLVERHGRYCSPLRRTAARCGDPDPRQARR